MIISKKYIKHIRKLRLKKYRYQAAAFVLEGTKNVQQLLTSQYEIEAIIATPSFIHENPRLLRYNAIKIMQTNKVLLSTLGTFQCNNDVLAVAKIPIQKHKLSTITNPHIILVLDDIKDPGNLGTILRIADWYNINTIICSEETVDLYNPKVLHASMGSFLHVNVLATNLVNYLKNVDYAILGASTTGDNIHQTTLPPSGVVVIGSETQGINKLLRPYISKYITIPSYGKAESLNAAIATAIICDHWRQQHPLIQ